MPQAKINAAGLRLVRLLVGNEPQTFESLIRSAGVTRTAVAEQLRVLLAAGLVERTIEKLNGRGRPRHRFAATRAALESLSASSQPLLVPAVWRAVDEIGGAELLEKVFKRVGSLLAERYSARITATDLKERLQQFVRLLEAEGALVELGRSRGRWHIRRRSCPFISLRNGHGTICAIDLDLLSAVAGREVRRVACRQEGSPSCVFEVAR
jgi:predicted ArsR family transcriptional regulator